MNVDQANTMTYHKKLNQRFTIPWCTITWGNQQVRQVETMAGRGGLRGAQDGWILLIHQALEIIWIISQALDSDEWIMKLMNDL